MIRSLILVLLCFTSLFSLAQTEPTSNDVVPTRIILILPSANITKINAVKTEFAKYTEIKNSVYVFQDHHALLIEFNGLSNATLKTYADVIKVLSVSFNANEIFIKVPTAYSQIYADKDNDENTITLK